ncbi:hypothetical protein V6N11_082625 [Hibiscus sabdariffa]|uniref:Retrotransposon gag domain-containing protein n=1 Tax=Hibiscus sabdariffa TaxID=183260 RepID=A0ABR2PA19_9ROSI
MTRNNPQEPLYAFESEIERTRRRLKRGIRVLMGDHNEDLDGLNPAVIIPEFKAEHFELKPVMFNMLNTLGQVDGSPIENVRQHLKSFLEICNSIKIHGVSNDVLKLKLFPYSLRDTAKDWLNNLPPGSFQSWIELCQSFLAKFSYNNLTDRLRSEITSFRQEDDEDMHEAWERYRDLFPRCPMHGLSEWTQVSIFYNSVNTPIRMMFDASANGMLLDKPPREGLEILEKLAQNDYQHPTTRRGTMRVSGYWKFQKPKGIPVRGNRTGTSLAVPICPLAYRYDMFSKPPTVIGMQGYQSQPRQNQQLNQAKQDYQQPNNYRTLEATLNTFMTQTSADMARTDQFIQKTDAFMDRTEMQIDTEVAKGATHEQCKAISTRSGKVLKTPTENKQGEAIVANSKATSDTDSPAPADTPASAGEDHNIPSEPEEAEIIVHINLPLVEALRQMPNYAKFLKDMMSKKIRIGEFETAAATEACLAMMHNKKLDNGEAKPTTMMLQLADRSYVQPEGKIEDILVRVDKFIFPSNFLILDCKVDEHAPIILGRPFLATSRMLIEFEKGELVLRVDEEQVKINVFSVSGQQDTTAKECKALNTSVERSTRLKPYLGAHTEKDKGVVTLRDA